MIEERSRPSRRTSLLAGVFVLALVSAPFVLATPPPTRPTALTLPPGGEPYDAPDCDTVLAGPAPPLEGENDCVGAKPPSSDAWGNGSALPAKPAPRGPTSPSPSPGSPSTPSGGGPSSPSTPGGGPMGPAGPSSPPPGPAAPPPPPGNGPSSPGPKGPGAKPGGPLSGGAGPAAPGPTGVDQDDSSIFHADLASVPDLLEHWSAGSVVVARQWLEWGEPDAFFPGPTEDTGVEIGRRFFGGLGDTANGGTWDRFEGEGSVGRGWVHSFYERLFDVSHNHGGGGSGVTHIQHVDWNAPYNDPAHHYVDDGSGTRWVAPAWIGGEIETYSSPDYPTAAYRLKLRDGRRRFFDGEGRIVARANASELLAVRFEYDPVSSWLSKVIDTRGREFSVGVVGAFIRTVTDPAGNTYTYHQNGNGELEAIEYPARPVLEHSGDTEGQVPADVVTRTTWRRFAYDGNGSLTEIRNDANELLMTFTYAPWTQLQLPPRLERAITASANSLNPAQVGDWLFRPVANGGVDKVKVKQPRGYVRTYELDAADRVVKITQDVNPDRLVPGHDDAVQREGSTAYTYTFVRDSSCSDCGRVVEVIEPPDPTSGESGQGGRHLLTYDSDSNLTLLEQRSWDGAESVFWHWQYDSEHRKTLFVPPNAILDASDPLNVVYDASYAYTYTYLPDLSNPGGTIVTTSTPAGGIRATPTTWKWTYDARHRMTRAEAPGSDVTGGIPSITEWEYYPDDAAITNPDFVGFCKRYTEQNGAVWTEFEYSPNGLIVLGRRSTGEEYVQTWNAESKLTGWMGAVRGPQRYQHEWYYDAEARVSKFRYSYYANATTATFDWAETDLFYTTASELRLVKEDVELTPRVRAETTYLINGAGDRYGEIGPDGRYAKLLLDEVGRPHILSDAIQEVGESGYVRQAWYTDDGKLDYLWELADGAPVEVDYDYDGLDRMIGIGADRPSSMGADASYDYLELELDASGRPTKVTNLVKSTSADPMPSSLEYVEYEYADWHEMPTRSIQHIFDESGATELSTITTTTLHAHSGAPVELRVNGVLYASIDYDDWGFPTQLADGSGNALDLEYDVAYGFLKKQTNTLASPITGESPLVLEREYARDDVGRVTQTTYRAPGEVDVIETFEYDSLDNVVTFIDGVGVTTARAYGMDGRLLSIVRNVGGGANESSETHTYSPGGDILSVTDNRNQSVYWNYDGRRRLKEEVNPDGTKWEYGFFDNHHLLRSVTTPTGRHAVFEYDDRLLVSKRSIYSDPSETSLLLEDAITWSRSGSLGSVSRTTYAGGTSVTSVAYTRDSSGNVLTEQVDAEPPVLYTRDALRRVTRIDGSASTHIYDFDGKNRPTAVRDGFGLVIADTDYLGVGTAGRRVTLAGGNLVVDVLRSGFGQAEHIDTTALGAALFDYDYDWDAVGRLSYERRGHDGGLGDVYGYDGLGRLLTFTRDSQDPVAHGPSTPHAYENTYHMDADFHRTAVVREDFGAGTVTADYTTHPTRHHYTTIDPDGAAGPLPARVRIQNVDGNLIQDGDRHFIYDALDNLVRVEDVVGGVTTVVAEYGYDALGRRASKVVGNETTRFVHSGAWIIEEWTSVGGGAESHAATHYHFGTGLDDVAMSRRLDVADLDDDGSTTDYVDLYHHRNQLGSVMDLTLADGTVVESYRYDAYGAPTIHDAVGAPVPAPPSGNRFLFSGREHDPETGLYHYRARTFDPETGTFLQEDPIGLVDSVNPLAYVLANPVTLTDPAGTSAAGDAIDDLLDFLDDNRELIGQLLSLTPLGDLVDLISAVTGKDFSGWMANGFQGEIDELSWWQRAVNGAAGALRFAGGALSVLSKIDKIKDVARSLKNGCRKGVCKLTGDGCFVPGTLVLLAGGGHAAIETIQVGDHVAYNPAYSLSVIPPEPETLVEVDLLVELADGTWLSAILLRSVEEAAELTTKAGFDLPESGLWGEIRAKAVRPVTREVTWGPGLVTGTFLREYEGPVVDITPAGAPRILATPEHPVYSSSDVGWLEASERSDSIESHAGASVQPRDPRSARLPSSWRNRRT